MDLEAPSTRIRIFLKAELLFPFQAIPPQIFPFSVECVSWYSVHRSDWKKKKLKKRKITRFGRRPGTPASLLWNLETTRHEPKINMAETLVDVIVELRQREKKDQPTKLLCDTQASLTFHQLKLYWFFRLKELFQVKNGLTTSSLFFLKCQQFGSVGWR